MTHDGPDGSDPAEESLADPSEAPAGPESMDEPEGDGRDGFDAWRRRSAVGEVGTAIARGLGAVFAPTENRPVVSAPVPGDPPDPGQGFRVVLDPDDPSKGVVVFTDGAPPDGDPTPA